LEGDAGSESLLLAPGASGDGIDVDNDRSAAAGGARGRHRSASAASSDDGVAARAEAAAAAAAPDSAAAAAAAPDSASAAAAAAHAAVMRPLALARRATIDARAQGALALTLSTRDVELLTAVGDALTALWLYEDDDDVEVGVRSKRATQSFAVCVVV